MAKKASVAADGSPPVKPKSRKSAALSRTPLRSSSLLDTRVVYCGDNLEQAGRKQKEEGRMMKPATHSPILHSSFILLNFPVLASHYVKVMLDQILGESNFQNETN